jgi:hypothetical protein
MQQFIPFEDDWDALEQLRPEALIPYRVGLVQAHQSAGAGLDPWKPGAAMPAQAECDGTSRSGTGAR